MRYGGSVEIRRFFCAVLLVVTGRVEASVYGINAHIPQETALDRIAELGIGWIRVDFLWSEIEIERGHFHWEVYDRLIARAEARSLSIYACISSTPAWATEGEEGRGVPFGVLDYGEFCYRAAARYRGRVQVWGFWNEPNLNQFWQGSRAEYLLKIFYPGIHGIHAADRKALVAAPDLAHLSSSHWRDWLRECLISGGEDLDIAVMHVYPSGSGAGNVIEKLEEGGPDPWDEPSIRSVLENRDWLERPFWLTETGLESGRYGESVQADYYEDLLAHYFFDGRAPEFLGKIFFYELNDGPDNSEGGWGILGPPPNFPPKEASSRYAAFIDSNRILDGAIISVPEPSLLVPRVTANLGFLIENRSSRAWTDSDGICLAVQNLPPGWSSRGGCLERKVEAGATVELQIEVVPPDRIFRLDNEEIRLRVRLQDGEHTYFGLPGIFRVFSGWRELPRILQNPVSQRAVDGGGAVFRVVVDNTLDLSFRWSRNGLDLRDGPDISGAFSGTLVLSNISREWAGEYRCKVEKSGAWLLSLPARLTMEEDQDSRVGGDRARGHPESDGGKEIP